MKTTIRSLALYSALASSLALAADPVVQKEKEMHLLAGHAGDFPKGSFTFLGVETVPVSGVLTDQLGLPAGTGLVINTIAPGSPAALVLKPHDILMKFDDQKLIETRQLRVLVRGHQDGDEVTLTYIRGGKEATAKVKLIKEELPDLEKGSWQGGGPEHQSWQNFNPNEEHLRRLGEASGLPQEEIDRILPLIKMGHEMHVQVIHSGPGGEDRQSVTVVNANNSNLVLTDDAGTLEVKVVDGKKDVVAKNAKGEVVFSGPFNTEAERKAAPADVRQRLDKLERMEGVRFKADADFHPGESDLAVPAAHRIIFRPRPAPSQVPLPALSQVL